jgi:hypothetical protein
LKTFTHINISSSITFRFPGHEAADVSVGSV